MAITLPDAGRILARILAEEYLQGKEVWMSKEREPQGRGEDERDQLRQLSYVDKESLVRVAHQLKIERDSLARDLEAKTEALRRFLDVWDEFEGPPLTVEETHAAVAESVEGLRAALSHPEAGPDG